MDEGRSAADSLPTVGGDGNARTVAALEPDRPPSLKDVARISGVSFQTVSRVVNGSSKVLPETRARVLAAIEVLAYRPNGSARALRSGRTRVIGVLSIGTSAFETPSTLEGIENAAVEAGYAMSFAGSRDKDGGGARAAVARLIDQRVDGCILIAPRRSTDLEGIGLPAHLPVVTVEGDPADARTSVAIDHAYGSRLATEHLLALGHETVWHVSGPADWYDSVERTRGWREALLVAGAVEPPLLYGDWSHASGYQAGRVIAELASATAVFAANDSMSLGLMHALHDAGMSIPEDISVVGFDDLPEAAHAYPPLTTIRQEFFKVGRRSIELLVERIERPSSPPTTVRLKPTLVSRSSTAAAHCPSHHG